MHNVYIYIYGKVLFNPELRGMYDVQLFFKGISPKVNLLARVGFELVYYDVAVQHVSHHATGTPSPSVNTN